MQHKWHKFLENCLAQLNLSCSCALHVVCKEPQIVMLSIISSPPIYAVYFIYKDIQYMSLFSLNHHLSVDKAA